MSSPQFSIVKSVRHFLLCTSGCLLFLVCGSIYRSSSSLAAEKIVVRYGLLEQSLSVEDLRKYVEKQQVSSDLKFFLGYLSPKEKQKLLEVLQMKIPLDVVTVDKLINSEFGKQYLYLVAPAITRRDNAGIQALRSAIILGARSPQGLGIISVLAAYPSDKLVVNLPVALEILSKAKSFSNFSDAPLTDDLDSTSISPAELQGSDPQNQK